MYAEAVNDTTREQIYPLARARSGAQPMAIVT